MEIRHTKNGNEAVIFLSGRFDFNVHREFKESYVALLGDATIHKLVVDLAAVDYLDSSALGMMLMLRERVQGAGKTIALRNPNETVIKILDIANFQKLFPIA